MQKYIPNNINNRNEVFVMDIGNKAKILFNELTKVPFNLLYLLETPNESKRNYQNNTMKPLPEAEPFLGIGGKSPHIDMRDYAYHPGYVSSHDK